MENFSLRDRPFGTSYRNSSNFNNSKSQKMIDWIRNNGVESIRLLWTFEDTPTKKVIIPPDSRKK